jgi:hypothetical protein
VFNQLAGLSLRLEHRHSDGSWSDFERSHHDPAEHDPERAWSRGEIYVCKTCNEQVRVSALDDETAIGPRGAA